MWQTSQLTTPTISFIAKLLCALWNHETNQVLPQSFCQAFCHINETFINIIGLGNMEHSPWKPLQGLHNLISKISLLHNENKSLAYSGISVPPLVILSTSLYRESSEIVLKTKQVSRAPKQSGAPIAYEKNEKYDILIPELCFIYVPLMKYK